jgi:hypothetical protein
MNRQKLDESIAGAVAVEDDRVTGSPSSYSVTGALFESNAASTFLDSICQVSALLTYNTTNICINIHQDLWSMLLNLYFRCLATLSKVEKLWIVDEKLGPEMFVHSCQREEIQIRFRLSYFSPIP